MLSESLIIGLVVLLLCGAVSFYIYARMMYSEKKLTVMESILVDMRVALDSIMSERSGGGHHVPIAHTPGGEVPGPQPQPAAPEPAPEAEAATAPPEPEDKFYTAVLDQVHEDASVSPSPLDETAAPAPETAETIAFEKMSRPELVAYAEKNGLRVRRNMSRGEIETMLRRTATAQNATSTTGAGNVSGSMEGPQENGAPLSGDAGADSNASNTLLESTI
jgi:hypothetical protein